MVRLSRPPISTERQARVVSYPPPPPSPHWQNKTEDSARRKETPWDFTLYLTPACRFLTPSSLSCLILSGWTFSRSYILFYHFLHPYPFLVLSSSLILFGRCFGFEGQGYFISLPWENFVLYKLNLLHQIRHYHTERIKGEVRFLHIEPYNEDINDPFQCFTALHPCSSLCFSVHEKTPLNICQVSHLLKRAFIIFFDGLSECTRSSVVFS